MLNCLLSLNVGIQSAKILTAAIWKYGSTWRPCRIWVIWGLRCVLFPLVFVKFLYIFVGIEVRLLRQPFRMCKSVVIVSWETDRHTWSYRTWCKFVLRLILNRLMEYFCFKTNKSLFRRDETDAHMAFELLKNKQKKNVLRCQKRVSKPG